MPEKLARCKDENLARCQMKNWRGESLGDLHSVDAFAKNSMRPSSKSRKSSVGRGDSSLSTENTSTVASLPSEVCCDEREAMFNAMVNRVVSETVFPKKQFIILERELDEKGKLASKCLSALHMKRRQWHTVKELIRTRLNRKRNNIQLGIRRNMLRKYTNDLFCVLMQYLTNCLLCFRLYGSPWR